MEFPALWSSLTSDERLALATRAGTTVQVLRNVAAGKPIGPRLAVAIEAASDRQCTRPEMVEDWRSLWPELTGSPGTPNAARAA